eukprot:scaffold133357_cov26-Prasinocladus_malaysianus.AAC.1
MKIDAIQSCSSNWCSQGYPGTHVGVEDDAEDKVLVADEGVLAVEGDRVPQLDGVVARGGGQQPRVRAEADRVDGLLVALGGQAAPPDPELNHCVLCALDLRDKP